MNKKSKRPWKSGYGALFSLFGFPGFLVAVSFLVFSLHDPSDITATIFLGLGLFLFGVCTIFGVANWIIEKKVNRDLVSAGYTVSFEIEYNFLVDNNLDPLAGISHNGHYVSRTDDSIYTVSLEPSVYGVSLYIFRNSKDIWSSFCVVYNRFGFVNNRFKAFARVS